MSPKDEKVFRQSLAERSKAILDDAFVETEWLQFCNGKKHGYLSALLGHNRVLRKLNGGGHVTRLLHGDRPLLGVKNVVCCETHREAIETIFNHGLI